MAHFKARDSKGCIYCGTTHVDFDNRRKTANIVATVQRPNGTLVEVYSNGYCPNLVGSQEYSRLQMSVWEVIRMDEGKTHKLTSRETSDFESFYF